MSCLVLILFCLFCKVFADEYDKLKNDIIYYKSPVFDIKNANVTFGAIRRVLTPDGNSAEAVAETLASTCQAILINSKAYPLQINGKINLVYQDFIDQENSGQRAILTLLENNLFYSANNTKVNQEMNVDLTGFFGSYNLGTVKINSLSVNGYNLPFVAAGDLARNSPDNKFSGIFTAQKVSLAQVLSTSEYSSFNAIVDILKFFNWTLVANLYEPNSYGYLRQQNVLVYSAYNNLPMFACGAILGAAGDLLDQETGETVTQFCSCVTEKKVINVVVLWMSTSYAQGVIKVIRTFCPSASKNWTFVISEDFQNPSNYLTYQDDILKYSLFLRDNGPWDFGEFVNNCQKYATGKAAEEINRLVDLYYREYYNCVAIQDSVDANDLEKCEEKTVFRPHLKTCLCQIGFAGKDPYASKLFFIADIINVYAAAISLLQNNCTFLNEKFAIGASEFGHEDRNFCTETQFSPKDLSFALQYVNITGYTGDISFPKNILVRREANYYLYNTLNNTIDATLVGLLNYTTVDINTSKISFVNNEIPISRIIPQNPNLNFPVVAVFFGIAIFELIWCFLVLLAYLIHQKNRVIKRSSPITSLVMLCSVFLLCLTQLLKSFSNSDAFCTINLFFFWIGIFTLLSCLFLKNYRIYKIFSNKKATAFKLSEYKLLLISFAIIGVYVIIMIVFVVVFGYKALLKQSSSNIYYQFVRCAFSQKTWNSIFNIFFNVSMALMVLGSIIMAWLTRKVSAEYSESKVLASFSLIVSVSILIFIPLSATLQEETDSEILRFSIFSEFLTIIIFAALGLLFMPKLIEIRRLEVKKAEKLNEDNQNFSMILTEA